MARDDDEAAASDASEEGEIDPVSGQRVSRDAGAPIEILIADFKRRAQGLDGDDLAYEVDRLVDLVIEREVGVVPRHARDRVRAQIREMLETDPTLASMLGDVHAAAARER